MIKKSLIWILTLPLLYLLSGMNLKSDEVEASIFGDNLVAVFRSFDEDYTRIGESRIFYNNFMQRGKIKKVSTYLAKKSDPKELVFTGFVASDGEFLYLGKGKNANEDDDFDWELKDYDSFPLNEEMKGTTYPDIEKEYQTVKNRSYLGIKTIETGMGKLDCHAFYEEYHPKSFNAQGLTTTTYYTAEYGVILIQNTKLKKETIGYQEKMIDLLKIK